MAGTPWRNVAAAVGLFSPQAGPPITPTVGIGSNIQTGPFFRGTNDITALFTQLLSSFPNLVFTAWPNPAAPLFCVAQTDPNTIVLPAQLNTGSHVQRWFPPGGRYYSKPLSDLVPAAAAGNQNSSIVPVCAVFTFDSIAANQYMILNLALYLDRWQFAADLWVHGHYPFPHPN